MHILKMMTAFSLSTHNNFITINFVMEFMAKNKTHQTLHKFTILLHYKTSLFPFYNKN